MAQLDNKYVFKIIIVGDSGVGKTSLMTQFVNGLFLRNVNTTVGVDYLTKNLTVDGKDVILQIWDTAGQERFQSLSKSFYRSARCCVIVYDVTRQETLNNVKYWKEEFLSCAQPNNPLTYPFIIIGNKYDLLEEGIGSCCKYKVSESDKDYNISSFLTTAKDSGNVYVAFKQVAEKILEHDLEETYDILQQEEIKLLHASPSYGSYCCASTIFSA